MLEHEYLAIKTHQIREAEYQQKNLIWRNIAAFISHQREERHQKKSRR